MTHKKAPKKGSRIKVGKLQKEERALTKDEQKNVKGGLTGGGIWIKSSATGQIEPSGK